MTNPRLLYLGHALPPGYCRLFLEYSPAGHHIETNLLTSLRDTYDLRSVGISRIDVSRIGSVEANSPGLPNALNLLDRPPSLWNWIHSLRKLNRAYNLWLNAGWRPDVIMVCNWSPVYNAFVRRLARQPDRPRLVLYLADSTLLGVQIPALKRLRYRLKPFKWMDDDMAALYDACVAVSLETEGRFRSRGIPWLWIPNGIDPGRARADASSPERGPIVFGYFGHANEHAGLPQLIRAFTTGDSKAELRVACFGKARSRLAEQYAAHTRVSFHGPFDPDGCLTFGAGCDVLVNPRPIMPGNKNNFPSKVFEYALTGSPILSSNLSGVKEVLGPDAFYFEAGEYGISLTRSLNELAARDRGDLRRRGAAIQQRMIADFSWHQQGCRLSSFLQNIIPPRSAS